MVRNSDSIQFPILYLIIPIIFGLASAVPAGDMVLQVFGIEPTSATKALARVVAGLVIGIAFYLVMMAIRRSGKN
jgi:hypothetical protein